jgi:cellulose synthase/poly-beta-1,6-N-acetylglucosamine synthase-like glycosyltransferase
MSGDVPSPARGGLGLQDAQVVLDPVGDRHGGADVQHVPHVPSARRPTPYPRVTRPATPPPLPRLELDARTVALPWQRAVLAAMGAALVAVVVAAALGHSGSLVVLLATVTALYCGDLAFYAYLVAAGRRDQGRRRVRAVADPRPWPVFTVLCPMYRETAVLPQFVKAIAALDYPVARLQVLLLLEEDDVDTIAFARAMALPPSFEIVVVPDGLPKTKPRACNHGLRIANGEYVVIFDAEDVPEPDQLRKAARAFAGLPGYVACLQAPLNFYNPRQNLLTRLFTAEYSLWFDLILPGLQALGGPIPLGGTSNHFRAHVLRGLGGWDPFNVTEDADLGIRLYKHGFRTGMLDSTTFEEANPDPRNWIRQRSRWVKGYLQTLLVHTRGGWRLTDPHLLTFLAVIGGKVIVNFVNPVMWVLTLGSLAVPELFGDGLRALFPPPVLVMAGVSLVVGNGLFLYAFLLGSAQRGHLDLVRHGLLAPAYWLMMSTASVKALWQLVTRPHHWEKTQHGLHLIDSADHIETAAEGGA